jgi:histidinol-phosphate aminotransferase
VTDWTELARPSLRGLEPYDPGPSREELRLEHGLEALEPLHWNEDRFGPPRAALEAAADEVWQAPLYPERAFATFRDAVAASLDVSPACLVPAHGAQALIAQIAAAFIDPGTPVVVSTLTYGLYAAVSRAAGAQLTRVPAAGLGPDLEGLAAAARRVDARIVWLCDPNNPTGTLVAPDAWAAFLDALPERCITVVDETYGDFAEPEQRAPRQADVLAGRRVIVIRSLSKIFGLAGLRLGYALADPEAARLLDLVQEPFNVNRVALAAGRVALQDPGFVPRRRAEVAGARAVLAEELQGTSLRPYPSHTNFVLVEIGVDDGAVAARLLQRGLLVRGGTEFGLPGFVRVTLAPEPVLRWAAGELVAAVAAVRDGT